MSPEDVHIRVLRLGHAIQAGLTFLCALKCFKCG